MKWILALIAFFIFIILLVTPSITNKYYDLAKRFRMLEEKTDSYGRYLASNLETYQKTRKPIRIYSKLNDNIRFNWKELEVPWDKSQFSKIKALEVWNDNLVVGLLGNTKGSISIYIYDEKKWIQLLGVKNNFIKEWEKLNYVQVLKVHNEKLYAGINNTVWMLDEKNKWVPVGVNKENSRVLGGKLFISLLKTVQIKSNVLQKLINYSNTATFPGIGKLVEYNGPYIRVS